MLYHNFNCVGKKNRNIDASIMIYNLEACYNKLTQFLTISLSAKCERFVFLNIAELSHCKYRPIKWFLINAEVNKHESSFFLYVKILC